jgi:3D (Asp-Asp-Asp) domain-containing protein
MRTLTALLLLTAAICGPGWGGTRRTRPRIMRMEATAFAQDAKPTAAGTVPHEGIVASDPAVLPLGSRIRITAAGVYNGIYTVTDTGSKINGRHVDLYLPSDAEAKQFGKKIVLVRILRIGAGKQDARDKDIPARTVSH